MKNILSLNIAKTATQILLLALASLTLHFQFSTLHAQGTSFTYQGRLDEGGSPANGTNYGMIFYLYDAPTSGTVLGNVGIVSVMVTNGLFTVPLNFGDVFNGAQRWLEIAVQKSGGAFATLSPRQQMLPAPYAIMANSASNLLGTLPSAQLNGLYSGAVSFGNAANTFDGSYFGDGGGLTVLNANSLTSGTVPEARLSSNVARLNGNQTFTGQNLFSTNVGIGKSVPVYPLEVLASQAVGRFTSTNTANGSVIELNNQGVGYEYFGAINFNNVSNTTPGQIGYVGSPTNASYDLMEFRVGSDVGFEIQGDSRGLQAPSLIGGFWANAVQQPGSGGDVIAGGGYYLGPNYIATNSSGAFIGAGSANQVGPNVNDSVIAGGYGNTNLSWDSVIGGGFGNLIKVDSTYSVIAGGNDNIAAGISSTVSGGDANAASGTAATVGGGAGNVASGDFSFAAGKDANAKNDGAFVWADDNNFIFSSTTANQFRVRATGGVAFVTAIDTSSGNVTAGVHLLGGDTAWSSISDKNAKKNFQPINGEEVLRKLAAISVEKWNYNWEADTNTPHIGPMAQDFKSAFYPGRDDKSISTLEFDGVELAAIQGLNQKLKEKEAEIQELKQSFIELKEMVLQLRQSQTDSK
jgi:hypothetical protein